MVCDHAMQHLGMPIAGCRVIIQGFGNVGSNAAKLLFDKGLLDCGVSRKWMAACSRLAGSTSTRLLWHKAQAGSIVGFAGAEAVEPHKLLTRECEILIPCGHGERQSPAATPRT